MGDPFPDPFRDPDPGRAPGGSAPLEHLRIPFQGVLKELQEQERERARKALAAHEDAIAGLLNRIALGQSKIVVAWGWNDPRPMGTPTAENEKLWKEHLRKQTMEFFEDLARTEAGFKLLSDLDASPYTTTIVPWGGETNKTTVIGDLHNAYAQPDGKPSKGATTEIYINAALTSYVLPGEKEQPWMTERVKYGLYHELVHAWHASHGTLARGNHNERENAEWQAVGLGPWAADEVSENAIRKQMAKELRPDVVRKQY